MIASETTALIIVPVGVPHDLAYWVNDSSKSGWILIANNFDLVMAVNRGDCSMYKNIT